MTWLPAMGAAVFLLIVSEDAREFGNKVYNACPSFCSLHIGSPTPVLEVALARTPIVIGAHVSPEQCAPIAISGSDARLIRRFRQIFHSTTSPIIDCQDVQLYLEFSPVDNSSWFAEILAAEIRQMHWRYLQNTL